MSCIYHAIGEEDVERILRYPHTMVASDGGIPLFGVDVPHPRTMEPSPGCSAGMFGNAKYSSWKRQSGG